MRLIDADALFKEEREEYRNNAEYISTDYKHIFAEIDDMPTVCDIEQIRDEIENQLFIGRIVNHYEFDNGLKWCLEIIDKYR